MFGPFDSQDAKKKTAAKQAAAEVALRVAHSSFA
jgi:hypothetical protein